MKIVHCGDFHFNRPFSGLDSARMAALRREEQREAFKKIAYMAKDSDCLLIAGDLFDNPKPDFTLTAYLADCLKKVPRVFISPGNHDPHTLYEQLTFPENVHVFKGETECVDCGEFAVWGNCGCEIGDIKPDGSKINLLCIHADVNGTADYNSITENELVSYGFDYVALGHIHKYSGIKRVGRTRFAYCGAPFAGGFDETGDKGVICAEITKEGTTGEFKTIDNRRFREEVIILDNAKGYSDIVPQRPVEGDFYKITVKGTVSPEFLFRADILRDRIASDYYYLRIKDETTVHIPYEKLSEEYSLKGIFVRKMLERINREPDNDRLKKALDIGVRVLEGKKSEDMLCE